MLKKRVCKLLILARIMDILEWIFECIVYVADVCAQWEIKSIVFQV